MIVVILDYIVAPDMVDAHRPAHIEWLKQGLAAGMLMVAGRQVPATGGMLIARGDMAAVRAWAATDPFAIHAVADYRFIEMTPSMLAPGLDALAG